MNKTLLSAAIAKAIVESGKDRHIHCVGDRVQHQGLTGTVMNVGSTGGPNRVCVCRDFNGRHYWDDHDYWGPISEEE